MSPLSLSREDQTLAEEQAAMRRFVDQYQPHFRVELEHVRASNRWQIVLRAVTSQGRTLRKLVVCERDVPDDRTTRMNEYQELADRVRAHRDWIAGYLRTASGTEVHDTLAAT